MTVQDLPNLAAESNIIGVRFTKVGKLFHYDCSDFPEVQPSDYVLVNTPRGRKMGQVIGYVPAEQADKISAKSIIGPATPRDLMMKKLWEAKEVEALIDCREMVSTFGGFDGVKFVKASYNYDGSVLTYLYTTEEDHVNTGRLRRKLEQHRNTRVEMRRIGARDAAKLLGEYGACGGPRCCSTHLTEFSPISIKMAKAQGISLNPSEITGMCGRLRCCLVYEYEQYVEATKQLPRNNKIIGTPHGEGRVIDVNPLKGTVTVIVEESRHEVPKDQIIPLEELRALQEKAAAGCAKEGQAGPCECGARVRSGDNSNQETKAEAPPERPQDDQAQQDRPRRRGSGRSRGGSGRDSKGGGSNRRRRRRKPSSNNKQS
ncbi:MAG: hypothetical protein GYB68_10505 [Chloroflexi bacterium]|nr:hypothetical protein [Chloroflexota bacterium]